jgi:hypothetical protein
VIALFGIDQEQQDKLVQPGIAAIRYAEAACSPETFEFPTAHYSDNPLFRQPIVPTANNLAQQRIFFMTSGPGKQTTIYKTRFAVSKSQLSCRRGTRTDDEM